jgi:hypothetical protein
MFYWAIFGAVGIVRLAVALATPTATEITRAVMIGMRFMVMCSSFG